jgi:hypothetical protein
MSGASALLRIIEQRETDLLQRLSDGIADPFHLYRHGQAGPA